MVLFWEIEEMLRWILISIHSVEISIRNDTKRFCSISIVPQVSNSIPRMVKRSVPFQNTAITWFTYHIPVITTWNLWLILLRMLGSWKYTHQHWLDALLYIWWAISAPSLHKMLPLSCEILISTQRVERNQHLIRQKDGNVWLPWVLRLRV